MSQDRITTLQRKLATAHERWSILHPQVLHIGKDTKLHHSITFSYPQIHHFKRVTLPRVEGAPSRLFQSTTQVSKNTVCTLGTTELGLSKKHTYFHSENIDHAIRVAT